MMTRQMTLAAYFNPTGHHVASWRHPRAEPAANISIQHYVEMAQAAERAKFDMIFLADSNASRDAHIEATSRSVQFIAHFEPLTLLTALAASYAIWLLDFVAVWLLAQAVNLPLHFIDVTLAMSVAYASTILPISVGGHGIREGALLATLTALGALATPATQEQGLLLALLVWLSTIFWSLFGGLFSLAAPHLIPASKIQQ
jgi:uncharacterized membrane protein YbhN (UPF0104 family)